MLVAYIIIWFKIYGRSSYCINYLVISYPVEGCADPDLPERMWMKRDDLEALVGCKADLQMSWILKCVHGIWEGQVGICSSSGASVPLPAVSASLPLPIPGPPYSPTVFQNGLVCVIHKFEVFQNLI